LASFERAVSIDVSASDTFFVHLLVPTPAACAKENDFAACTSGFTTFFTIFRLLLRQSFREAFTPALINLLTAPAVTGTPG